MPVVKQNILRLSCLLIFVLLLSGCALKLISSYDEKTDNAITALQKEMTQFFLTVESQVGLPECKYRNHTQFYQQAKIALSAISVRVQAIEANELTSFRLKIVQFFCANMGCHLDIKVLESEDANVLSHNEIELILGNSQLARWNT